MPRALFHPRVDADHEGAGLPINPDHSPVTRDYPRALPRLDSPRREADSRRAPFFQRTVRRVSLNGENISRNKWPIFLTVNNL